MITGFKLPCSAVLSRWRGSSFRRFIQMSSEQVNAYRQEHEITLVGELKDQSFCPITTFSDAPFAPSVLKVFHNQGYEAPTSIQAQSWPIALAGRDMISVARTGSGKTCGFLLPAIHRLMNAPLPAGRRNPRVMVIAPTRELAIQIEVEAQKFSGASGLQSVCAYGGAPKGTQIRAFQHGVDIVIGTPGRINDLMDGGFFNHNDISYLVLDEADRMLDMGFEPQIQNIIRRLNPNRQNLFFTATWPKEVRHLAKSYLNDPVSITVGERDVLSANKAIKQHIHVVNPFEKRDKLQEILMEYTPRDEHGKVLHHKMPKMLIFAGTKLGCDNVALDIRDMGYSVGSLHGDKMQSAREIIMDRYRRSNLNVLVATDVAARGLDVKV